MQISQRTTNALTYEINDLSARLLHKAKELHSCIEFSDPEPKPADVAPATDVVNEILSRAVSTLRDIEHSLDSTYESIGVKRPATNAICANDRQPNSRL